MRRRLFILVTAGLLLANGVPAGQSATPDDSSIPECTTTAAEHNIAGSAGVMVNGVCISGGAVSSSGSSSSGSSASSASAAVTRTVDCGHVAVDGGGVSRWDEPVCGAPRGCTVDVAGVGVVAVETFATEQQTPGSSGWTLVSTWCPGKSAGLVGSPAVREQVLRLLPKVKVGWPGPHLALVNVQELFWVPSTRTRDLGTVTVVGQAVRLRVQFAHADWDFGDGSSDTTTTMGQVYDQAEPCATKQCPGFYGHTYTTRGQKTITLTVTWTGQYSLNNGTTWTTIAGGPITATPNSITERVWQARAQLINPAH